MTDAHIEQQRCTLSLSNVLLTKTRANQMNSERA